MHDLHATILHQLGLDHEKLTFRYSGRNFRLTDVHGRVVREVLHNAGRADRREAAGGSGLEPRRGDSQ